jgi:hypothetical protein
MYFVRSAAQGLKAVVNDQHQGQIAYVAAILAAANVVYSKGQEAPGEVYFKIDAKDVAKVEALINEWTNWASDTQYAMANVLKTR